LQAIALSLFLSTALGAFAGAGFSAQRARMLLAAHKQMSGSISGKDSRRFLAAHVAEGALTGAIVGGGARASLRMAASANNSFLTGVSGLAMSAAAGRTTGSSARDSILAHGFSRAAGRDFWRRTHVRVNAMSGTASVVKGVTVSGYEKGRDKAATARGKVKGSLAKWSRQF
jgi:hypothetical protein